MPREAARGAPLLPACLPAFHPACAAWLSALLVLPAREMGMEGTSWLHSQCKIDQHVGWPAAALLAAPQGAIYGAAKKAKKDQKDSKKKKPKQSDTDSLFAALGGGEEEGGDEEQQEEEEEEEETPATKSKPSKKDNKSKKKGGEDVSSAFAGASTLPGWLGHCGCSCCCCCLVRHCRCCCLAVHAVRPLILICPPCPVASLLQP